MLWTRQQVVDATGAAAGAGGGPGRAALVATGVSIDTRSLEPGQMFVALRGERDGHDFAPAAVASGAGALLVQRPLRSGGLELVVPDPAAALLDLGRAARRRLDGPVIGITGSVGKTSTKDLAAATLSAGRRAVSSPGSYNNELGLPLTLANAPEDTEVVVLEMGARGPGHIALLCEVARPTIGVVTSVAAAHTDVFGDLEGVARAKGELIESLPESGTAVLNGDDDRVRAMKRRSRAPAVLYSVGGAPQAEVVAVDVTVDEEIRPSYRLESPWGWAEVRLEARGVHQVGNSLAAVTVALLAGVALDAAVEALRDAPLSPLRMEVRHTPSGAVVVNDAYNANPTSMAAALRALAALPARRRVAVLGPMAELGRSGPAEHRDVVRLAAELGVEVVAVGTRDYGTEPVEDPAAAVARLGDIGPGTAVLVKASRVAALEWVATHLLESGTPE